MDDRALAGGVKVLEDGRELLVTRPGVQHGGGPSPLAVSSPAEDLTPRSN